MEIKLSKLPKGTTEDELRCLFSPYGALNITLKGNEASIVISDEKGFYSGRKDLTLKGEQLNISLSPGQAGKGATPYAPKKIDTQRTMAGPRKQGRQPARNTPAADGKASPYDFKDRAPISDKRATPPPHNDLMNDCYDIAFEVAWETMTPTAANPCVDEDVEPTCPKNDEEKFKGYNRRWLMTADGRLAISPFTVKSAIANGFANLMGGCYRVNDIIHGHPAAPYENGTFPYTGKYKRYRANRASSKPGIIDSITHLPSGDRKIVIERIEEYLMRDGTPLSYSAGQTVYAKVSRRTGGDSNKPPLVENHSSTKTSECTEALIYHGSYTYGMGPRSGKYSHRFYTSRGTKVEGIIPCINFKSKDMLKENVCLGTKGPAPQNSYVEWYQNLAGLVGKNGGKPGSWVYFEEFNDCLTNIGLNFEFKALFLHEDAVPGGNRECEDMRCLCPRCGMFGMSDKQEGEGREAVGYRGRFKASALVSGKALVKDECDYNVPQGGGNGPKKEKVTVWLHDGKEVCRQHLLPIQGPPKPNKRDINGYYDKRTGEIQGAKYYLHAGVDIKKLVDDTDRLTTIQIGREAHPYAHKLRNYAMVCEKGEQFMGVLGAESCTAEEAAALFLLLHSPESGQSGHGFKVGIGKAFGLGSVKSTVSKVWIRSRGKYEWELCDLEKMKSLIPGLQGKVAELKKGFFSRHEGLENRTLLYPLPVEEKENGKKVYYWDIFNSRKRR